MSVIFKKVVIFIKFKIFALSYIIINYYIKIYRGLFRTNLVNKRQQNFGQKFAKIGEKIYGKVFLSNKI